MGINASHTRLTVVAWCITLTVGCGNEANQISRVAVLDTVRADHIHEHLEDLTADGFAGSVVVAEGGEPILKAGYGLANRREEIPFTTETVSDIGSITKPFTATAVLNLVARDELKLTDTLAAFFPEVRRHVQGLTLHQLLLHTAGLQEYCEGDFDRVTRERLLGECLEEELRVEPGTEHRYSNVGYSVLAAVVEKVTGTDYETYLDELVFTPLGMDRTGYLLPDFSEGELAVGYRSWGRTWGTTVERLPALDGAFWALEGNGGIHSTVEDMYRWYRELRDGAVLPDTVRSMLFEPRYAFDEDSYIGYGWGLHVEPDGTVTRVGAVGGNDIFYAIWIWYPQEQVFVYLMTNNARYGNHDAARWITRSLLKKEG